MCNNYYISTVHVFNRGVQIRMDSFGFRNKNIHIGSD